MLYTKETADSRGFTVEKIKSQGYRIVQTAARQSRGMEPFRPWQLIILYYRNKYIVKGKC